jgi:hypothetical protein
MPNERHLLQRKKDTLTPSKRLLLACRAVLLFPPFMAAKKWKSISEENMRGFYVVNRHG